LAKCFIQLINGAQTRQRNASNINRWLSEHDFKDCWKNSLETIKKTKFERGFKLKDLDPPTCLNLRLVGHSFPPGSQPFILMVKISPSNKINFRPAGVSESVYQTVQIVNTSDTPVYFKLLQDPSQDIQAFPPIGMIKWQIFLINLL